VPDATELDGEGVRRDTTALPGALGVARDRDETVRVRPRDDLGDERGRFAGEAAPPVLLPRTDERPRPGVVHDRRAGLREREPSPGALRTAAHWPRPGRSATLAHGRDEPRERATTSVA